VFLGIVYVFEYLSTLVLTARYQRDVDPVVSAATAERFYHQAFMLFPEIG
jgi:hypothetical protein